VVLLATTKYMHKLLYNGPERVEGMEVGFILL